MFRLAKRADIQVSAIRKIFQQLPAIKAKREKDGLDPLIDLSIGQPHIAPNPVVMQKLAEMQPSSASLGYSSAQGEPATLESIIKLYKNYYPDVDHQTSQVMATIGGSGGLSNIFSILVEKEDDVILTFEPYFGAYTGQIKEWGGTLKMIPTLKDHFRPTTENLEQAIAAYPNAKAIIVNYPNNPSGVSLTKAEVINLATVLEKHPDILIIIDDVYRDFNYLDHFTILDVAPHLKDRCVVINSGAKGLLGSPGVRVGMLSAHEELIKKMLPRQTNGLSSVPCYTQAALRFSVDAYLEDPQNDWLLGARNEYKKNLFAAETAFKEQGFTLSHQPTGAFYLLACAKHLIGKKDPLTSAEMKSDLDLVNYFLHNAGVAVVPGSGFGIDANEGYIRISCANDLALILEAAKRMGDAARLLLAPVVESHLVAFSLLAAPNVEMDIVIQQSRNSMQANNS